MSLLHMMTGARRAFSVTLQPTEVSHSREGGNRGKYWGLLHLAEVLLFSLLRFGKWFPALIRFTAVSLGLTPLLWMSGCVRQPEPIFSLSERSQELPERHQQNIADGLAKLFGTPSQPRLLIPVSDDTQDDAEANASQFADADTDEEFSGVRLTDAFDRRTLAHGAQVYRARCGGCHGVEGDGRGEAQPYLQPHPRDYRNGVYKFTSTPYGAKPTRQDLIRTIRRGAKGTSMPSFPWMSDEDVNAVTDYIIYLSQRGEVELLVAEIAEDDYDEDEELDFAEFLETLAIVRQRWHDAEREAILPVSARPEMNEESIRLGREIFVTENCWSCHGKDGKGQTEWFSREFLQQQAEAPPEQRIEINYDAWGQPAPAADLTARMLHGGRRPIDIYRRIHTGINGTPMPSFGQLFADEPEKIWHLVHYILYIAEGGDPMLGESELLPHADAARLERHDPADEPVTPVDVRSAAESSCLSETAAYPFRLSQSEV